MTRFNTAVGDQAEISIGIEEARKLFDHAIREMIKCRGFNVTIGGNGSVEILKDFEIIKRFEVDVTPPKGVKLFQYMIDALRRLNDPKIPKGLKISDPDLTSSVYTSIFAGDVFGVTGVKSFTVGIYGSSISQEAIQKGGYIVLKPTYG